MKDKDILDSWKEICIYLDRNIRTCQRWETDLGLPVHRFNVNSPKSKVFAYKSEIDKWLQERSNCKEIQKKSIFENRLIVSGLVFASAFILIIFTFSFFSGRTTSYPSSVVYSLAFIPFESLNSPESDEYFAESVSNELIDNISKTGKLNIVPLLSESGDDGTPDSKKRFRRELKDLNIDYLLKGAVEKNDENIKMNIQFVRIKNGKSIWEEQYEGKIEDILHIQQDICKKISGTLEIDLDQGILLSNNGTSQDYIAFDNYLKGNYLLNRINDENDDPWKLYFQGKFYSGKWNRESNELAIGLFREAINIDRYFALAYFGLAHCYVNYVNFNWDFKKDWLDKAEELVEMAQEISPDLPEYYAALSEIFILKELDFNRNENPTALELAQEGIEKYPYHPRLNSLAGYCYFIKFGEEGNQADFDKAFEYKEKSFLLSPYKLTNINLAELLMLKRDFTKAIGVCNYIEGHDSSLLVKFRLGEIYYYMGDLGRSRALFQQFNMPLNLKIYSLFYTGMIEVQEGNNEEAQKIIKEIDIIKPKESRKYDEKLMLASIYMGLGNKELGYKYLESIFRTPGVGKESYKYRKYINIDRNFDLYRNEDRFKQIIQGENIWLEAKRYQ